MASDDRDPHADLASITRDAAGQIDRRLAGSRPAPDFAAMMARARELAEDDEPLAPLIALAPTDDGSAAALAPFTAALRAELDAKIAAHARAGVPPLRTSRRPWGVALAAVAAVAAALLLLLGGPQLARESGRAAHAVEANDAASAATHGGVVQVPELPLAVVPPSEPVPEDILVGPPPPPEPVPGDILVEPPRARREAPRRRPPPPVARTPQASLEEEAQALWQRGELAAAEAKLRAVLALAGDERRAELAYGDLFALVRQMRGAAGQEAVWREYLGRFPRGRFADDARAGLCRRAPTGARAACWQDYLERHPDGAHRQQAAATEAP